MPFKTYPRVLHTSTHPQGLSAHPESSIKTIGKAIILPEQEARLLTLVQYIEAHFSEDQPIYDFTNQGALYFILDRPAGSRFHQAIYASSEKLQRQTIDDLLASDTQVAIYHSSEPYENIDYIPMTERCPLINEFLLNEFPHTKQVGDFLLRSKQPLP